MIDDLRELARAMRGCTYGVAAIVTQRLGASLAARAERDLYPRPGRLR